MSVLGRNWRFLTISTGSASLVRGKTEWIRKPPFYPLNYGNNDIGDCRFSSANCKQRTDLTPVGASVASFCENAVCWPQIRELAEHYLSNALLRIFLVHRDRDRLRRNSIRNHFQGTAAGFSCHRNVEVSRDSSPASCNSHCAVSMRPGIEDMVRCVVGDPDQRIVGSRF